MLIVLVLLACHSSVEGPSPPAAAHDSGTASDATDLTWYGDVEPIVSQHCADCHHADASSDIQLSDYASFVSWSVAARAAIVEGRMPPWGASSECNNYVGDMSLTDQEVSTIVGWIDGGMAAGTPSELTTVPEAPPSAGLDRVDRTISMSEAYSPSGSPDDYRCFLLPWPYADKVWVTGFELEPGNTDVVHHIIPFVIQPSDVSSYLALDEQDPGPGYGCYGGPGGDIDTLIRTKWLGAWAPGSGAMTLPSGTGISVEPGSMIAMQVHYYSATPGEEDQSSIHLRVEEDSQGWADLQPWTDVLWVAGLGMEIPANTSDVSHTFEYTISDDASRFAMYSAQLHMHQLGRSGRLVVERASGEEDCVLDVPQYDFTWQRTYSLEEPVVIEPGDTVKLTCVWDNLTDRDVSWGDGTGDEMCLGVTLLAEHP